MSNPLSEWETIIVKKLADDRSRKQIQADLRVSAFVINRAIASAYETTKAKSPAGLVAKAIRNNWIP